MTIFSVLVFAKMEKGNARLFHGPIGLAGLPGEDGGEGGEHVVQAVAHDDVVVDGDDGGEGAHGKAHTPGDGGQPPD